MAESTLSWFSGAAPGLVSVASGRTGFDLVGASSRSLA